MTAARKTQIHIDTTLYYHCISGCLPNIFRGAGSAVGIFEKYRIHE